MTGSVCEALARPDEGEALTRQDDHDISRQQVRQRIEVMSAHPEPMKLNAAGWAHAVALWWLDGFRWRKLTFCSCLTFVNGNILNINFTEFVEKSKPWQFFWLNKEMYLASWLCGYYLCTMSKWVHSGGLLHLYLWQQYWICTFGWQPETYQGSLNCFVLLFILAKELQCRLPDHLTAFRDKKKRIRWDCCLFSSRASKLILWHITKHQSIIYNPLKHLTFLAMCLGFVYCIHNDRCSLIKYPFTLSNTNIQIGQENHNTA